MTDLSEAASYPEFNQANTEPIAEVSVLPNPYEPIQADLRSDILVRDLIAYGVPAATYERNVKISENWQGPLKLAAYVLPDADAHALLAKSLQGKYFYDSYVELADVTRENARLIEGRSEFILAVSLGQPENILPAVAIRVANMQRGMTPTVLEYEACTANRQKNHALAMTAMEGRQGGVLDIGEGVMALQGLETSAATAFTVRTLVEHAAGQGIHRLIGVFGHDELDLWSGLGFNVQVVESFYPEDLDDLMLDLGGPDQEGARETAEDLYEQSARIFCSINLDPTSPIPAELNEAVETWYARGEVQSRAQAREEFIKRANHFRGSLAMLIHEMPELIPAIAHKANETGESATIHELFATDVTEQYEAPFGDQQVVVFGSDDYRAPAAMAIEKFNMMYLGDPEALVDKDLALALPEARYLAVFPADQEPADHNMLGVVRITEPDPDDHTIRSFREVAEVTGDDYETVWNQFVAQTGQTDPFKTFDVNTYGMSPKVWKQLEAGDVTLWENTKNNLMLAMVKEGMRMRRQYGATHGISYFNENAWGFFRHMGYKWDRLGTYQPTHDSLTQADGTVIEGQPLIPTVLDFELYLDRLRNPDAYDMDESGRQHQAELARHLLNDENV